MDYISLYKLFYSKPDQFQAIYSQRYENEDTIHLHMKIGEFNAFICSNFETMHLIERICYFNQLIINHLSDQEVPYVFRKWMKNHTLVEEIVMTNEIEGVISTHQEIESMLDTKEPKRYLRFYGILNKYREIINKEKFEKIEDSKGVRKLYEKILIQDIKDNNPHDLPDGAIFRKEGVDVRSPSKVIHKGLTPESKIIENMDIGLDFLNDERYPLLVRIAAFHYIFCYIHPFYDGNGRMARFISSYYLSEEFNEYAALQLATSIKKNQSDYYEAFKITNDSRNKGDITYFVIVFLDLLLKGLEEFENSISETIDLYKYYDSKIDELLTGNQTEKDILRCILQESLLDTAYCTIDYIRNFVKKSVPTVRKYISDLDAKNYIYHEKRGKKIAYFFNHEIFDQ
jgi:Fic family protein